MSVIVKTIDNRFRPDSDGNKYYVALCSRKSEGAGVGHAFVVWGKEDAAASMSSQAAFGFYPKDGISLVGVLGTGVPGEMVDEATTTAGPSLLTSRVIVRVNAPIFDSSRSQIAVWTTEDYNLSKKNCISFARAVASDIGLRGIPMDVREWPSDYLEALAGRVSSTFGGIWQSVEPAHRFALSINGPAVDWVESATDGSKLLRSVETSQLSTKSFLRIDRPNNDEVLEFLGFLNASLRAQILSKTPEPSYLVLERDEIGIIASWHGLLVKKLANGSLDQIVQPSQIVPKQYRFAIG